MRKMEIFYSFLQQKTCYNVFNESCRGAAFFVGKNMAEHGLTGVRPRTRAI